MTALSGSSNAFVTKPHHFDITDIKQTANPKLANPKAASATDAIFVKAGEPFSAKVTAMTSGGSAAPNFGKEIDPQDVALTNTLVLPSPGATGVLTNATLSGEKFSGGVATVDDLSWSEVGIIKITPGLAPIGNKTPTYLGAGDVIGGATGVVNVGRFIPDHFAITAGTVEPACSKFLILARTVSRRPSR